MRLQNKILGLSFIINNLYFTNGTNTSTCCHENSNNFDQNHIFMAQLIIIGYQCELINHKIKIAIIFLPAKWHFP